MLKHYQRRDTLTQKLHSRLRDRASRSSWKREMLFLWDILRMLYVI